MLEIQTASELQLLSYQRLARLEGLLGTCFPLILLFISADSDGSLFMGNWEVLTSSLSIIALALLLIASPKKVSTSIIMLLFSLLLAVITFKDLLLLHPGIFLLSAVIVILSVYRLSEAYQSEKHGTPRPKDLQERALWALGVVPLVLFIAMLHRSSEEPMRMAVIASSTLIATCTTLRSFAPFGRGVQALIVATAGGVLWVLFTHFPFYFVSSIVFFVSLSAFPLIFLRRRKSLRHEKWYDFLLDNPSRNITGTFLFLSLFGTVLLSLPIASAHEPISIIDASFTAVSAVCVTGLTVLDTPHDFSMTGQIFVLFLIQIGGLGIMTIVTVGIFAVGRRLSLKKERAMLSMMNTSHSDLASSLKLILIMTFSVEGVGALLLTIFYAQDGMPFGLAVWNGIFTSISGFCNAGFALFTDSLVGFQSNPGILLTVSFLIILGGISPALVIMIPQILKNKRISLVSYLVFSTTGVLLLVGTLSMALFEWDGVLSSLSPVDKILNAWFQSATFRTAGFNSVSIGDFSSILLIISMLLMFIGGSPGGTAGGIKTTTVAVLFLSFWNTIRGNTSIEVKQSVISQATINRALAILIAALTVWGFGVFMLIVTQNIPVSDLLFEATSAIGTVGLSTGITAQLDEVGKIIIMLLMYAGRISPITLFMLFSQEGGQGELEKPEVSIVL